MNLGTATVLRGDARHIPLADESVDLVVTSPPYWALRSYSDGGEHYDGQIGGEASIKEFVDALLDVTRECVRVLKPTGSLWVNLGDKYSRGSRGRNQPDQFRASDEITYEDEKYLKDTSSENSGITGKSLMGIPWRYAIGCIDELDLILRAEVIWDKGNGGMPESVTDRVRRSHEHWFHFTRNQRYFANLDPIREPHAQPDRKRADVFGGKSAELGIRHAGPTVYTGPTNEGRIPGSVWTVNTEPLQVPKELGTDHFAAFPTAWPKRLIQAWCPEGGTVLDPFGGTGTTAMVAKALGRNGITLDMSADYCKIAEWRTNDRNQLAKVLGIPKIEKVAEDQLSLFTEDAA